ncbi:hypothetical protein [Arthrobacter sp. ZGTC131]
MRSHLAKESGCPPRDEVEGASPLPVGQAPKQGCAVRF